ncbi:phosphatidate cytidylyltransferase [Mycetohabitans endofungorum]|uniref:phosphatidate cytidylyltransferase n=1 Tax=Mycetohabitans endofungorum TaxID=417203 RepID=UPI002B052D25|nr:phosphatidate cytidylyltransferase [Mycetohabitans endofungorum]
MLRTRVVTAIVLLAVLLPVTLFAPLGGFGALIGFVLVFAAWEWAKLLKLPGVWPFAYAALAGVVLVAYVFAGAPHGDAVSRAAAVFWIAAAPFALLRKPTLAVGAWRGFLLAAGLVLFVACWHALVAARATGVIFVLSLLLIVWLADIGAYFAGRRFGRHKLAPAISPGKTWEGVIGGWLSVVVVAALALAAHPGVPTVAGALVERLGVVVAVLALSVLVAFSVVGDLFESLLKRQAGVKDSSQLLPGHGGVLDRIDALLPVLPLAMLLLS